jgi:transcription antitermination protein NusB
MSLDQRSAARLAVVQALYQMEVAGKGLNEIFAEFESHWMGREMQGVLTDQVAIDRQIDRVLSGGWPLARLESVMRAALRAGAYELRARKDVPPRVVIKEYVDVAAAFFGPTESGMVNAVLDKIAREERAGELG